MVSWIHTKKINFGDTPMFRGSWTHKYQTEKCWTKKFCSWHTQIFLIQKDKFLRANIGSTIKDLKVPKSHFSWKFLSRLRKSTHIYMWSKLIQAAAEYNFPGYRSNESKLKWTSLRWGLGWPWWKLMTLG